MESIKIYVFIPPIKRLLYFYYRCFSSIPYLNYLWNPHRDTWYISTTLLWRSSSVVTPNLFLPLRDIIQNRNCKLNKMEFYVLLKYILFLFHHLKEVRLILTKEGSSKKSDFFTKFQWPLISVNIKKSSYQNYNYFTSYHPYYPCQHWLLPI